MLMFVFYESQRPLRLRPFAAAEIVSAKSLAALIARPKKIVINGFNGVSIVPRNERTTEWNV